METLLVLTDFSPTSEHAAKYACELAKQFGSRTIVLYHSFEIPIPTSEVIVSAYIYDEEIRQTSMISLQNFENKIVNNVPEGVTLRLRSDTISLNDINTVAQEEKASLIIMGTKGKTRLEDILLGSGAITVCKHSNIPTILVPPYAEILPVEQIVFACDMKEIEKTVPVSCLRKIFNNFKVPINVLNVEDNKHSTQETPINTIVLHEILNEYNPEYYNIHNDDVVNGIIEFAKYKPATIVLLVSKKHNFIESIFYKNIIKRLAFNTTFPLLVVSEKKYDTSFDTVPTSTQ